MTNGNQNSQLELIKSILTSIFLAVLIVLGIFWARNLYKQNYYIGKNPDIQRNITITGEGKVTAIPDIANVSLGLSTEKKTVAEAQTENSTVFNNLINKLTALGIAKEDIRTANYYINPAYDYPDNKQVLRGYVVSQNADIKIRQTDKVAAVLQLAGELNLNQIGGLTFTIDDPEVYNQQAREKALAQAKDKAEALAKVMGVKLGKIINFSENENYVPPVYTMYDKAAGIGGGGPAPAIEAGSQDISIMATITYELD
jgi:uncharacterized protein YggE